ncbi:MAG: tetratricopeptide repeat protein [Paludibacteraceae bacterium]|nr:tetratricopeptide repeat protein [Paludibacteraceae bacterium]MBR2261268.1 tetratricopeptide repeat protein [Paludibacteraceae bacterium]MEE3484423.1 tetratricopeptide repeat protein [Bacteroidales bacterium]
MDKELNEIKERIASGDIDGGILLLKQYIERFPESHDAYFIWGNACRRKEDWQGALNAYQVAIDINPESPARLAYDAIQEVLAFYNKDMFNQ